MKRKICGGAVALWLSLVGSISAQAQITAEGTYDTDKWLRRDSSVGLRIAGASEGRLAVFLDSTDVTDLLRRRGDVWLYRSELLPLPVGETEWVIWQVGPGGWQEVARIPLKVLRKSGLETREQELRLDLQGQSDLDAGGTMPAPKEERLTAQIDLQQRASLKGVSIRLAANLLGVSEIEQALRFGERGERADRLDLSSWGLSVTRGKGELGFGHLSFGESRQLIDGFSSRGATLRLPLGSTVDLRVAALNGSAIVGWDNFLGLSRSRHQVLAGSLGVELLPKTPGAMRLEGTFLDGSLLPLADFNRGEVTDREESDGWSLRVQTATPAQRFRLDAAVAESRFTNPTDPFLAQGEELVEVERETRGARYGDLSWVILRRQQPDTKAFEVAVDLRHQRVEPQYRTVAAFLQSDRQETAGDLRFAWGGSLAQVSWSSSRDNLDDLASVLTTRTRQGAWSFNLPFSEWSGDESSSPWWPVFTLTGQRIHQKGDDIPVNGGFSASHIPDQISFNHQAGLQWSGSGWSLGATASSSEQDNRQPGRENADFLQRGYGLTVTTTPLERLDLGFDLRHEEQENLAQQEDRVSRSAGLTWSLRLPARQVLSGSFSWTESRTDPGIRVSEDLLGDAQWAWSFERRQRVHGWSGQLFLRWAYQQSDATDFLFAFDEHRIGWKVTGGFTMSLF
ncbi:MAG: hypothetical protein K0U98_06675 [Deltaproteobacteria bacterium]|nr:hypothetical protein [Deltaproteobacteria bacterium]